MGLIIVIDRDYWLTYGVQKESVLRIIVLIAFYYLGQLFIMFLQYKEGYLDICQTESSCGNNICHVVVSENIVKQDESLSLTLVQLDFRN